MLLLAAVGAEHPVEAALAAAELLLHRPRPAAAALLRSGRARALVAAALAEAVDGPSDEEAGGDSIVLGDGGRRHRTAIRAKKAVFEFE